MVGGIVSKDLTTFITESELHNIISQNVNGREYEILNTVMKAASENSLLGFLGDHYKVQINVKLGNGEIYNINLFIKSVPRDNIVKADFINEKNFFKKESTLFNGPMKEFGGCSEPDLWRARVYLATDDIIVMRDHSYDDFVQIDKMKSLDYDHCATTLDSVAKFHSSTINYESKRNDKTRSTYRIIHEYEVIEAPTTCFDCPWLRSGVHSILKFLGVMSQKYSNDFKYFNKIEENLLPLFLEGCDLLRVHNDKINVVVHRDLWTNNILFRHNKEGRPINAMLIDFQCVEYGPVALDIMAFLYLSTEREFRNLHEESLLKHYYEILTSRIEDKQLNYNWDKFLQDAQVCRKFGMVIAMLVLPYIMMDPVTAKLVFDDPSKWEHYNLVDRSEPMISYAESNMIYKTRNLEIFEEFIEKYIL